MEIGFNMVEKLAEKNLQDLVFMKLFLYMRDNLLKENTFFLTSFNENRNGLSELRIYDLSSLFWLIQCLLT